MEKIAKFITKYANIFCILALLVFCYLFLFHGLWMYPLIDVDETRYIQIAREMIQRNDWVTMFHNYVPFMEKPPLYFWLIGISFKLFGVSEFAGRFPTALIATFGVFFTYFFGKKVLSPSYGFISAMILLTSFWFLLFSHVAILDLGISVLIMASIYSALLVFFVQDKNKKFCWWFAYIFAALGVLYKGLPGFAVPALTILISFGLTRRLKEVFKPINLIPGFIFFFAISLPWHILIYQAQGDAFVQIYIIKHHLARFISSEGLGRKRPFLFYIPIFLGGFLPWTISFISACIKGIKVAIKDASSIKTGWMNKFKAILSIDTNDKKLLVLSTIYLLTTFIFYSASSSKLPPYILVTFPAAALICGYYWWGYVVWDKFTRGVKISTYITSILFIIIGCAALLIKIPIEPSMATELHNFLNLICMWTIVLPFIIMLCLIAKNRPLVFISKVIFMLGFILISNVYIFNFVFNSGQDELVAYSNRAAGIGEAKLVAFDFPVKSSMLWTYEKQVNFIYEEKFGELEKAIKTDKPVYIVVKNKHMESYGDKFTKLNLKELKKGNKYSLYIKE